MKALAAQIAELDAVELYGRVVGVRGLMVEVAGPLHAMSVGSRVLVEVPRGQPIPCEVVGFSGAHALLLPFAPLEGLRRGCRAVVSAVPPAVRPSAAWLGRVVNAMGAPLDGKGPLPAGPSPYPFRNLPPPAHARRRVGAPLDLGVRALNTFLTCCRGQRLGIFAGSGVGKSVLLSMLARNVEAAVSVIGLVGERGREVQEFLQDDLGEAGLRRSVVVVSTSDEPALMRRQAAYLTLAIAEYFRDQHQDVLVLMDSVTRFAMAQREIGLSAGEPPTAKGYTPTVFTELPRLLERAGPGINQGTITGIFTVLVDGDDHNEPVADAVRSILDGHIVMERAIAERGRYPSINVLKSISRTMPRAADPAYLPAIARARQIMATYSDMEELIRLGAYRPGSSADVDEAIALHEPLEAFLGQDKDEATGLAEGYRRLAGIVEAAETEK
ncbi:MAG TPA: flagellar protein export ATPase FliI [Xanthobacteraceae bacterium]